MIVLDNSVFMAALFADEKSEFAVELHSMLLQGEEYAIVPPIFLYEACNAVMNSLRRKRATKKISKAYLQLIYEFPLQVDDKQNMPDVAELAFKHNLTIYDASYLELAKREDIFLATFDKILAVAAKKEGVYLMDSI